MLRSNAWACLVVRLLLPRGRTREPLTFSWLQETNSEKVRDHEKRAASRKTVTRTLLTYCCGIWPLSTNNKTWKSITSIFVCEGEELETFLKFVSKNGLQFRNRHRFLKMKSGSNIEAWRNLLQLFFFRGAEERVEGGLLLWNKVKSGPVPGGPNNPPCFHNRSKQGNPYSKTRWRVLFGQLYTYLEITRNAREMWKTKNVQRGISWNYTKCEKQKMSFCIIFSRFAAFCARVSIHTKCQRIVELILSQHQRNTKFNPAVHASKIITQKHA